MVGTFGQEPSAQIDELLYSTRLPAFLALRETEIFDGLGTDVSGGRVHYQDYLLALVHQCFDDLSDSVDVRGECLGGWAIGACADEWDYLERIDTFCGEDVDDFEEDGGSLPKTGDEDEGWFGHY